MLRRWQAGALVGAGLILPVVLAGAASASFGAQQSPEVPATAPAPPQPPGWPPSIPMLESQMLDKINAERAAAGAGPVQNQPWAHSAAEQHSRDMAAAGNIFHNMSGYIAIGRNAMGATFLGENVAMDSTLDAMDQLLYSDPPHRAITLDPRYNNLGVGIALDADNWVYVTEDFARIPAASGAPVVFAPPAPVPVAPVTAVPRLTSSPKPVAAAPQPSPAPAPPNAGSAAPRSTPAAARTGTPRAPESALDRSLRRTPVSHTSPLFYAVVAAGVIGLLLTAGVGRRLATTVSEPVWRPLSLSRLRQMLLPRPR